MLCIILVDHPHGSCKHTFLKPGLRVEKLKISLSCSRVDSKSAYFVYWWHHRPAPPPQNNNNNNGGLRARVGAAEDIEPIRVTTAKYSEKKDYGQPTSHFLLLVVFSFFFYCLFVYSEQTVCACSVSTACWVVYNRSVWTQIFLKRCRGRRRKKACFGTCGHGLTDAHFTITVHNWTVQSV